MTAPFPGKQHPTLYIHIHCDSIRRMPPMKGGGHKDDERCKVCIVKLSYRDLCCSCFSSEILEMTVKELRMVGKELGVSFGGKTLKSELQRVLVDYKTQISDFVPLEPLLTRPTSTKEFFETVSSYNKMNKLLLDMSVKELRMVGQKNGVSFGGKALKTELQSVLTDHKTRIALNALTVKELKQMAKDHGINLGGKQLKADIVNAIDKSLLSVDDAPDLPSQDKSLLRLLTEHKSVSHLRNSVSEARHNIDIYSKMVVSELENAEVDHIVETQMIAHCAEVALKSRAYNFVPELSDMVNPTDLANYNVCSKTVNISKGQVVKLFLNDTDGLHADSGIRAKPYYKCHNHMGNITQAWIDVFPTISESVRTCRRDGYVQNKDFEQVATQLDELFDRMKLHDTDGIVTRSKSKNTK